MSDADRANYRCPSCVSGELRGSDGHFVCEDCGLDVTELLDRIEGRAGPLADMAAAVREGME